MSYILDALRKAERERHLGQAPNLTVAPLLDEPRTGRVSLWLGAGLGLGLGLGGALLALWLNRPAPPVAVLPAAPPPVIAAVPPAPVIRPVVAPEAPRPAARPVTKLAAPASPPPRREPVAKVVAPEPPPRREPVAKVVTPEPPPPAPAPARPERRESPARQPVTPGTVTIAPTSEPIPPLDTLPASTRSGLPALNLDIHIYSPDPQQRFVVINGRRYREGERLGEGLVLETVTGDGAILRQGSQRFRLSVRR